MRCAIAGLVTVKDNVNYLLQGTSTRTIISQTGDAMETRQGPLVINIVTELQEQITLNVLFHPRKLLSSDCKYSYPNEQSIVFNLVRSGQCQ